MADGSAIEWTEATWQPITGCTIVSPGCTNCYAMRLAGTRLRHHPSREGLTRDSKAGPVWTGEVRFNEQWLTQPLQWKRPRNIFVCAHGDLFHESVPDEWIDKVFAVMALAPQHTFQVLTKRAKRMREYFGHLYGEGFGARDRIDNVVLDWRINKFAAIGQTPRVDVSQDGYEACYRWPLPNVWLGVSAERQQEADERIPFLLETPAAVRWVSAEPLLGPIDLKWIDGDHLDGMLDWVVAGGESGPGARPMHPDWARSLRDQCAAAGVPFFFKQWGNWVSHRTNPGEDLGREGREGRVRIVHPSGRSDDEIFEASGGRNTESRSRYVANVGKKAAGRLLDGVEHNGMPERAS